MASANRPFDGPSTETFPAYPVTLYDPPLSNVGEDPRRMKHVSLEHVYDQVRSGEWAEGMERVRALASHKKERRADGKLTEEAEAYDAAKHALPFSVVSGHYVPGHRHAPEPQKPAPQKPGHADRYPECAVGGAYPIVPSGIRFVELDDINDAQALASARERLQAHPSVVACWLSPGGNGVHIFVLVDPKPSTNSEAHAAYTAVVAELGIAAVDDNSVKNLSRLAFVSTDPAAYWNPAPIPIAWGIRERAGAKGGHRATPPANEPLRRRLLTSYGEKIHGDKTPGSGPEGGRNDAGDQLVKAALDAMVAGRAGECDSHLLSVMGNLKVLGWSFEEFDQWAADAWCTCERRPRWDNPPTGSPSSTPGWAIVNVAAKHYEFRYEPGPPPSLPSTSPTTTASVPPPPPSWDGLTPAYQVAWIAHAAHESLLVVRDLDAGHADGAIPYRPYAVTDKGLLDAGESMTRYRVKAAGMYLSACIGLDGKEFVSCTKHAREMRIAKSAGAIADNVGASLALYQDVWKCIPFHTPAQLDADLSVIGTPDGVWSLIEHRLLVPEEARARLCTATIRWSYDPDAAHPVALRLFKYLYGDLVNTTTVEFSRWRHAATALARPPHQELIVKISATGSAKTTETNLQTHAFHPLVTDGERAAIEEGGRYNVGGSSHNSFLMDFGRPARRVNVSEVAAGQSRQTPLDSKKLRSLSEAREITYRSPGPHERVRVPYSAHLFIEGNQPTQGNDLLKISDPESDSARAVRRRLRGSPYEQIPDEWQDPSLLDYGNPHETKSPEQADDIALFNATIVRLMFDGMAHHWDLLMAPLPKDGYSDTVITDLETRGKPPWMVKWLPYVLRPAGPGDEPAHSSAVYADHRAWHDENGEGKLASNQAVGVAVTRHYRIKAREGKKVNPAGVRVNGSYYDGWKLAD